MVDEYKVEVRHELLRLLAKNEETSKAWVQLAFLIRYENTIALSNGLNTARIATAICSAATGNYTVTISSATAGNCFDAGNCTDPALHKAIIKVSYCCTGNNGAIMTGA